MRLRVCAAFAAGTQRAARASEARTVKESDVIFEELIATALEATIIVVESQLHGDPVPSLQNYYKRIGDERGRLYVAYDHVPRAALDALLSECGLRALHDEFRGDSRKEQESLRRAFLDVLFSGAPSVQPTTTSVQPNLGA